MPKALITGISGQDGSYLAEFLLKKGYQVYGVVRRTSTRNYERISGFLDHVELIDADLLDQSSLVEALHFSHADEVYHLAAMTFIQTSFQQPVMTAEYTALGVTRMLEAVRRAGWQMKFFHPSSAEIFGSARTGSHDEYAPIHPRSPYGVAKVYGHCITVNYRESYNLFACNGILFNHESPRRGPDFVTRKISQAVANIANGLQDKLVLGNLDSRRDWGFAGDYVEAIWGILQQDRPDDYVIATGEEHSILDFVKEAFAYVDIYDWERYVELDTKFGRPADVDRLVGDASKARSVLGWQPHTTFQQLVHMMVKNDLELVSKVRPQSADKHLYDVAKRA
jgi:GDPmannose 4,6-dehydratase